MRLLLVRHIGSIRVLLGGEGRQLIERNGSFDRAELDQLEVGILLVHQQISSLLCFTLLLRAANESHRAGCLDKVDDGRDRVVGRDENDAISETHESDLGHQQIEARVGKEADLFAGLILVPDSDALGVVGSGGANGSVEISTRDVLPLEGFGRLDVRDAHLIVQRFDDIVDEGVGAPSSLEGSEQARAVGDGRDSHVL